MIAKRFALTGALALLSASFAFGQSTLPSNPLQPQSSYTGSVPTGKPTPEVIKLSFIDALERGLKQNLGALLATNGIEEARGEKWKKLGDVLPNLTTDTTETAEQVNLAQTGFTKISVPGFSFSSVNPIVGPFGYFDTRAYLSVPLFNLNAWNSARSAEQSVRASQHSYKDARELVILVVGYNYLQTISAASRVETVEAQVKTAEALSNQAADQLKAGTSPAIDSLRARVEFQTRQQQLISARNDYEKQRIAFARTIGLPPGQAFELTEKIPYDPQPPVTVDEALQRAYTMRADYLSAESQMHASELARRAASAEYYPTLSFDGNYGVGGPMLDRTHGSFEVMGSLKVPIFQGGKTHGDVLQADSNLANSRAQLANLKSQIDQDVRDALFDVQSATDQVTVARSNVDLASQTLDQARDRFSAGVTDNIEVVQAQDALAAANESLISSLFNYNVARISLARSEGIAETGVMQYLKGRADATKDGN
jgi:outer membrane protein TolC